MATPVLIQNQYLSSSNSSTTTEQVTMTAQTAGDTNIACVTAHLISGQVVTCTVSDGTNTYSNAVGPITDSGSNSSVWIFYLSNISSGTPTITATFNHNVAFPELLVEEWSNLATSTPVDATGSQVKPGAGSGDGNVAITTSNANDLIVTAFNNDANGWTAGGSGFTNIRVGSPGNCYDYKIVTSTGTYTDTPVAGGGSNTIWQGAAAAFKVSTANRPFSGGNLGNINVTGVVTPRLPGANVAIVQHQPSFGLTASYNNAQTAGNANIVFFSVSTSATITVSDSVNGAYTQLGSTQLGGVTWGIWYFFNIKAAAAMANTVTVSDGGFNGDLEILEVTGLLGSTDGYLGAGGFSTSVATGNLTTTNANDLVLGFYGTGNTFSAFGAGWTGIDGTGTQGSEYQIVSGTGAFNATFTTTGNNNWGAAIGAFPAKAGAVVPLRPGPLSGSIVLTGSVPAAGRVVLRPAQFPGLTAGILGLTGRVNTPLRPNASGTLGVTGRVHGRLNTPNQIIVTGSANIEYTFRPFPPSGTFGLTSTRLQIRLVGTVRPQASGAIHVTSSNLVVRFNPYRPAQTPGLTAGTLGLTCTMFVRFGFIRPAVTPGLTAAFISPTGVISPSTGRLVFRPIPTGQILTSGGTTTPRLILRPSSVGPVGGTISVTTANLHFTFLAVPGAKGALNVTGLVNPRLGGVTREPISGAINLLGVLTPRYNPFRPFPSQFSTLTLNFSGVITPRLFFPGRVAPPVFGSGWNVVAGVWGAYYTVLMVPGVNYNEIYSSVITPVTSQQAGIAYQIANGLY